MQEESIYEELISFKDLNQQPRLSNTFQIVTESFNIDKVQAFLYDKYILLKFKVSIKLFRNIIKMSTGK